MHKCLQTMQFSQGLEKPHQRNCFLRNIFLFSPREVCQGTWTDNENAKVYHLLIGTSNFLTQKPSYTRLLSKALKSWCWKISGFLSLRSSSITEAGIEARLRLMSPRTSKRPRDLMEDVGWMSVGSEVKRRSITGAGESRQRALYDGPWSRHSPVTLVISLDPLFTFTLNS